LKKQLEWRWRLIRLMTAAHSLQVEQAPGFACGCFESFPVLKFMSIKQQLTD
jgi:hypothetical protein